jgi:hypothetical protein
MHALDLFGKRTSMYFQDSDLQESQTLSLAMRLSPCLPTGATGPQRQRMHCPSLCGTLHPTQSRFGLAVQIAIPRQSESNDRRICLVAARDARGGDKETGLMVALAAA